MDEPNVDTQNQEHDQISNVSTVLENLQIEPNQGINEGTNEVYEDTIDDIVHTSQLYGLQIFQINDFNSSLPYIYPLISPIFSILNDQDSKKSIKKRDLTNELNDYHFVKFRDIFDKHPKDSNRDKIFKDLIPLITKSIVSVILQDSSELPIFNLNATQINVNLVDWPIYNTLMKPN